MSHFYKLVTFLILVLGDMEKHVTKLEGKGKRKADDPPAQTSTAPPQKKAKKDKGKVSAPNVGAQGSNLKQQKPQQQGQPASSSSTATLSSTQTTETQAGSGGARKKRGDKAKA